MSCFYHFWCQHLNYTVNNNNTCHSCTTSALVIFACITEIVVGIGAAITVIHICIRTQTNTLRSYMSYKYSPALGIVVCGAIEFHVSRFGCTTITVVCIQLLIGLNCYVAKPLCSLMDLYIYAVAICCKFCLLSGSYEAHKMAAIIE